MPEREAADALVRDVRVAAGRTYEHALAGGRSLALFVADGRGELGAGDAPAALEPGSFAVVRAGDDALARVRAGEGDGQLHVVAIEVPAAVEYPLYRDGR